MLLSRLRKYVREQNWFAVVLETLIVIFSVTFAFQINEWNEDRKARKAEQEILKGLSLEFEAAEQEIIRDSLSRNKIIDATRKFLAVHQGDAEPESLDSLGYLMGEFLGYRFYSAGHPILRDLQSSGRLELIRNSKLRESLMFYIVGSERLMVIEEREREFVQSTLEPYVTSRINLMKTQDPEEVQELIHSQQFREMMMDDEFGSMIYLRFARTLSAQYFLDYLHQDIKLVKEELE